MSNKSPEAFRTISEVSKDLAIPQHVLRFWETKFIQIKPIKRGGGRRYYRPEDIKLLKGIKSLLYNDGYTIRGVQKVIKEVGTKKMLQKESENNIFTVPKQFSFISPINKEKECLTIDQEGISFQDCINNHDCWNWLLL